MYSVRVDLTPTAAPPLPQATGLAANLERTRSYFQHRSLLSPEPGGSRVADEGRERAEEAQRGRGNQSHLLVARPGKMSAASVRSVRWLRWSLSGASAAFSLSLSLSLSSAAVPFNFSTGPTSRCGATLALSPAGPAQPSPVLSCRADCSVCTSSTPPTPLQPPRKKNFSSPEPDLKLHSDGKSRGVREGGREG